jgi:hypothetical protein
MPGWVLLLTNLLPVVAEVVEKIHGDLAAHQKQQIVADTLAGAAAGVAKVAPQYAQVATDAATVAGAVASGVEQVVADAKANQHAAAVVDAAGTAVTAVAGGAAIQQEVNAPPVPVPSPGLPTTPTVTSSPVAAQAE